MGFVQAKYVLVKKNTDLVNILVNALIETIFRVQVHRKRLWVSAPGAQRPWRARRGRRGASQSRRGTLGRIVVGRPSCGFVGFLLFNSLFQNFARISPEFHQNSSQECHQNFTIICQNIELEHLNYRRRWPQLGLPTGRISLKFRTLGWAGHHSSAVRKQGHRTTGHGVETLEVLTERAYALSSYAVTSLLAKLRTLDQPSAFSLIYFWGLVSLSLSPSLFRLGVVWCIVFVINSTCRCCYYCSCICIRNLFSYYNYIVYVSVWGGYNSMYVRCVHVHVT